MKFAHMADCHIGSWRDPRLRDISTKAFVKAIDKCIEEDVDFVLIAGDLFNTSLPGIDRLKVVVAKLKELKDKGISVYGIPGSHDFSPSGRTMLDVLETAGLFINVVKGDYEGDKLKLKFTLDDKTGAKITGLIGKRGGLEKSYYENLVRDNLEQEDGYKIFMFHSAITELKPEDLQEMDSASVSLLPKNFSYYAGGHVHIVRDEKMQGFGQVVYPGPLFPNSFKELEELKNGGFYIVEDDKIRYEPIIVHQTYNITLDCNGKTAEEITEDILKDAKRKEFLNTIVTIRLFGCLKTGRPSEIDFNKIYKTFYAKSAYFVMKNTNKLVSKEFEEIKIETKSVEEIEQRVIEEHADQIRIFDIEKNKNLSRDLIRVLSIEKNEGEKVVDFERRVKEEMEKFFG